MKFLLFIVLITSSNAIAMGDDSRQSMDLTRSSATLPIPARRHSNHDYTHCNQCDIRLSKTTQRDIPCGHGCCQSCYENAQDPHCTHCQKYFGDIFGHHGQPRPAPNQ